MISCRDVREMLSPYIDGQLFERDRRRVQGHLETCEACRGEMEAALELEKRLRDAHASGDPGDDHMESLAAGFSRRFDLAAASSQWADRRRTHGIAFLPPLPSRWIPTLRIAFVTAVLAGVIFVVRQAGRLTDAPREAHEQIPASPGADAPEMMVADPGEAGPDAEPPGVELSAGEITAFFARILEEAEATPGHEDDHPTGSIRSRQSAAGQDETRDRQDEIGDSPDETHDEPDEVTRLLILEGRESDPSLPDAVWAGMWQAAARSLADQAMETALPEDCLRALRAYWRMFHRAGRTLPAGPGGLTAAYDHERTRLEHLIRCASGRPGGIP